MTTIACEPERQRTREGIDVYPDSKLKPKECRGFGVLSGIQTLGSDGEPVGFLARYPNHRDLAGILRTESGFGESDGRCVPVFKMNAKKGTCDEYWLLFPVLHRGGGGDLQVRGGIGGLKWGSSFLRFSFEIMQIDSGFPLS